MRGTIKSSDDISRLFTDGKRIRTAEVTLIVSRTERQHGQEGRVAFIAGKKLGNAVWRNRAKRRMRGLHRDLGNPFPSRDVIFLARGAVTSARYDDMLCNLKSAIAKSNLSQGQHG